MDAAHGRIVRDVLTRLLSGDAGIAAGVRPRAFQAADGRLISGRLARILARDALAIKRGDRLALTAAGRRQALALQTRTAS